MALGTLLIVDQHQPARAELRAFMEAAGYAVRQASTAAEARVVEAGVDLILLAAELPDADGLGLLDELKQLHPGAVVIVVATRGSIDQAIEAVKRGAFHYAVKPAKPEELLVMVQRGLASNRLRREIRALHADHSSPFSIDRIVARSPAMQDAKRLIQKTAASPASTVLLLGESGTGKSLLAQIIHHNSSRRDRAFQNITCSALPATLLESELFGHERGAFTDAKQQKKGLLELADSGTVFLDEFTEMDPMLQAKLLRFLEEKTFRRVGGTRDIQVDVRVIAATNREMKEAVQSGSLRKDLYYRLQVLTIEIPPLRQRVEDILPLADFLIELFNREFGKEVRGIDRDARALLESHCWEGNVRELHNAIERAMLFAEGNYLTPEDFPALTARRYAAPQYQLPPQGVVFEELERSLVYQALERCRGNRTRAAALLGMTRDQIRYRIEKFGLA